VRCERKKKKKYLIAIKRGTRKAYSREHKGERRAKTFEREKRISGRREQSRQGRWSRTERAESCKHMEEIKRVNKTEKEQ
jgi:hypothetical protein